MKKPIYYAIFMVVAILLPQISTAQGNLTGVWRLKDSKTFSGPNYTNSIPVVMRVSQHENYIAIEATSNNGLKDTIIKDSVVFDKNGVFETRTKNGKRKLIYFHWDGGKKSWLKQTDIFSDKEPVRLLSKNKEEFSVTADGSSLYLLRMYDVSDGIGGSNKDFIVGGSYERVTSEQLIKETATGKGINFTVGLTWDQIKAKAKKENKYIFIDCYATWCRPCKIMDKFIYPLNMIGDVMNNEFISVKVQMDTTRNDESEVKMLYSLARELERKYDISALPTYLFFSADGVPLHKTIGQLNAKKFIEVAANVKNVDKQLYTVYNRGKNHQLPWQDYPALVKRLKEEFREYKMADDIASIYYREYLNKLPEKNLLRKEHLDFIGEHYSLVKSSDKLFQISLRNPRLVDSIKQNTYGEWANELIKRIVSKEDVEPLLKKAEKKREEPDWLVLERQLNERYEKRLPTTYVFDIRMDWYESTKQWEKYLLYLPQEMSDYNLKEYSPDLLNRKSWNVFKYSSDSLLIHRALGWINSALTRWENQPTLADGALDTKACLLYKLGRKEEAISVMQELLGQFPQFNSSYQPRLQKMLKGEDVRLLFQ